ncbi:MAG: FIST C-terminal domain-containing protein, partial [Pseudomonadota bacterium]
GGEEEALAGIEDIVGHDVPIIGGSAADNSVEGNWYVLDGASHSQSGVVVSVLFPSEPVSFAYQNGYAPTEKSGVITKTDGRQVLEIDDQPAMQVYSNWTGGAVAETPMGDDPQPILSDSTMWPLGRPAGALNDVPFYLLAHPAVAHGSGAMDLFATVIPGEEITLMHGTQKGLVERAGRVASLVRQNSTNPATPPIGALMIYCGGCMLSVQDHLDDVVTGVNTALDGAPFLGAFTFGEQGPLIRGGNRHGNLMISCIIFG